MSGSMLYLRLGESLFWNFSVLSPYAIVFCIASTFLIIFRNNIAAIFVVLSKMSFTIFRIL